MTTSYSDYIIIGIVSLAIAFIMGMCIVSIIDRKLNDITINVPKPEVTVNMSGCKNDEIKEEFATVVNIKPTTDSKNTVENKNEPKLNRKIRVNPDSLDKILNSEQYDDVEGYKQYAVMGCPDRHKKFKLYPNIVSCNQPNYLTAENYYNQNFEYPYIPGQSEERWVPADYNFSSYLAPPDISYRIISKNKNRLSKKPPFPANYWFK